MKIKTLIFLVFYLLISGCTNDSSINNKNVEPVNEMSHQLIIVDTFKLKIPKYVPVPNVFRHLTDNKYGFSYSYSNAESQTIIECDIINKKWKIHTFDFDGPNGIKGPASFYITDNGEIIILPWNSNDVFVFDNNDKLIKNYKYEENVMIGGNLKYHCYYKNGIFYFPGSQYFDFKDFDKAKVVKRLDINKNKEADIVSVPKDFFEYHSDNSSDLSPEFVFPDDTTIVFIMRKSPNIYVYNVNTKETKYYNYPNDNIVYDNSDIKKGHFDLNYMNTKGYYHSILYDRDNKYYYRFSQFNHIKNVFSLESRRIRIDLFDDKFHLLASGDFKNLFPSYSFIVNGKLYIATLKTKENYMNYVVFSPKLKEEK